MKTLTTKATDNHGHSYDVTLIQVQHGKFDKKDWVLRMLNTPGGWYMTTLEEKPIESTIYLDMGQNWTCTNFDAVMAEAQAMLADEDRLTALDVKAHDDLLWAGLIASI